MEVKDELNNIKEETMKCFYKPYDIVTNEEGSVGIIQEVSLHEQNEKPKNQVDYAVNWVVGDTLKHAWFNHSELEKHGNIFIEIAKMSCHPFGNGKYSIEDLIKNKWKECGKLL